MEKLLTPEDLAARLGLSVQTIYNRRARGDSLPRSLCIGRKVRFAPEDVSAWLREQYEDSASTNLQCSSPAMVDAPRRPGRPGKAEEIRRRQSA